MRAPAFVRLSAAFMLWALPLGAAAGAQELTLFEIAFAEGIWAFSQGDAPEAVAHFQEALHLRPDDGFARYMLGLSYLGLEMPREAAAEIAASLGAEEPPPVSRSRVLADLGAAQLTAGDVQAAIVSLEEALKERGSDAVALHHYARALEMAGRREEAEAARAQARAIDSSLDPEDLPITTPKVVVQAPATEELPRLEGTVSLTAAHDSNPNLLSEEILLPIPSSDTELVDGTRSDSVANTDLRVSFRPVLPLGGWRLAVNLRGGGSFHQELNYLDLVGAGVVVHLARGGDRGGFLEGPLGFARVDQGAGRQSLLVQGGVSEFLLDGASYLRTLDAAAAVTFSPSEANATRLELQFQDRSYSRHPLADPRRSGQEVRIGVRQYRFFGEHGGYVALGAVAADRNAGRAFDRSLLEGEIEASFPITSKWTLGLTGAVSEEDFDDPASNLLAIEGEARQDSTWRVGADLSFALTDRLSLVVRGTYTERDSNIDLGEALPDLDYRRTTLSTGLSWAF
jgi:tetratricopeptide (TPR) repeat protein